MNNTVAGLLNNLLIEFTQSRARRTNDNAWVEGKKPRSGAASTYAHLPQKYAGLINELNRDYLNLYLNVHRPCFFPEVILDATGKQKKLYRDERMMTPYKWLPPRQAHPRQ